MATNASTSAARSRKQRAGLVVMRRRQLFQKQVLARKLADDRRAAALAEHPRHADLHRVREVDDVRLHVGEQPVDELFEFLALMAGFAAEHRDGHVAELRRVDAAGAARQPFQQGRVIEQPVEPPRRVAEQRPTSAAGRH